MKFKQTVNLLLIALFVWAFHGTTLHFQHHVLEEISECKVCDASKNMKLYQHNTPVVVFNENLAVKIRRYVEKVIVHVRFDYADVPHLKSVDMIDNGHYSAAPVSLGFNANAPPVYFL